MFPRPVHSAPTIRGVSALTVSRVPLTAPGLGAAWSGLQAAGHVGSPFLSWQWVSALRDVPGAVGDTGVLVARRGDEVVGLLPLERAQLDGRRGCGGWGAPGRGGAGWGAWRVGTGWAPTTPTSSPRPPTGPAWRGRCSS